MHLAVESGAAPEVVNLIIVANWGAIVTTDQSGRIPTEILDRNELLLLDDHRIVHESLRRCHITYTNMQKVAQEEQAAIKRKHKATFSAVTRRQQEELKREQDKQEEIRKEVQELEIMMRDVREANIAKDQHINKIQQDKETWIERVESLERVIELLQMELNNERDDITTLTRTVEEKDNDIAQRDERIDLLSCDLRNISVMHDDEVMDSVLEAEQTMRSMVSSQIALQKQLAGQANGLQALLKARGITMFTEEPQEGSHIQEEKDAHPEGDDVDPASAEAISAVAASAVAALQKPPVGAV